MLSKDELLALLVVESYNRGCGCMPQQSRRVIIQKRNMVKEFVITIKRDNHEGRKGRTEMKFQTKILNKKWHVRKLVYLKLTLQEIRWQLKTYFLLRIL